MDFLEGTFGDFGGMDDISEAGDTEIWDWILLPLGISIIWRWISFIRYRICLLGHRVSPHSLKCLLVAVEQTTWNQYQLLLNSQWQKSHYTGHCGKRSKGAEVDILTINGKG